MRSRTGANSLLLILFLLIWDYYNNVYVESLNGKLRDELLAVEKFTALLEAKIMVEDY